MRSEIWRAQALLVANSNEDATASDQWNEEAQRRYDEASEDVQRTVDEMLARESTSVAYERALLTEASAFPTTVRQWLSENEIDDSQLAASDARAEQEEAALIDWAQKPAIDRGEAVSTTEPDDLDRQIEFQIALDRELADRRAQEAEETRMANAIANLRRGEIANEMQASASVPAVFKPISERVIPKSVIAQARAVNDSTPLKRLMSNKLTGAAQRIARYAASRGISGVSLANLLANVSVESDFRPRAESYIYRIPERAISLFSALRRWKPVEVVALIERGRGAFFEAVYGRDTVKGRELGNRVIGDGAKYAGQGYLQLTGYTNVAAFDARYPEFGALANPNVLSTNPEASAASAVFFWEQNVVRRGLDGDIRAASLAVNPAAVDLTRRVAEAKRYLALV